MRLLDFDDSTEAIISPCDVQPPVEGFPLVAVGTFSGAAMRALEGRADVIAHTGNIGSVYRVELGGVPVALFQWKLGAPACAAVLEEIYAMGAQSVVAFGSCGVLDGAIADGHFIIPSTALRDEGTSYHYAPPSEEMEQDARSVKLLTDVFEEVGAPYVVGKTWTTDAFYRETRAKVRSRRESGCICVEMECAALIAVAKFRKKRFAQFLYAADNLDAPDWEPRGLIGLPMDRHAAYLEIALRCAAAMSADG